MRRFLEDIAIAVRHLPRQKGAAVTLIGVLALAAAVTAVSFDLIAAYLWRPLPYPEADRLVIADYPRENGPSIRMLQEMDWTAARDVAELVIASDIDAFTVLGASAPFSTDAQWMTADVFAAFAAMPSAGRFFTADEGRRGDRVAVISRQVWRERFNGDASVIGRSIIARATLRQGNAERYTIVGVLPATFSHLDNRTGLILPLTPSRPPTLMRLRPGVTAEAAAARLTAIVKTQASGVADSWSVRVQAAQEGHVARIRPMLTATLSAVVLLLAAAFANLAFFQMARGVRRQREMAVRSVIGASGGVLIRELMAEALVIGTAAAVVAVAIIWMLLRSSAAAIERYVGRLVPGGTESLGDPSILVIVAVGSVAAALALAAVLHIASTSNSLAAALAGHAASTDTPARSMARQFIAAAQVAVAFCLLVAAVLLVRSAWHLRGIDLGFEPRNVLTANVTLHESSYRRVDDRRQFFNALLARLRTLPGVSHAGLTGWLPFRVGPATWVEPEHVAGDPSIRTSMRTVSPGYLETLGVRLVEGRLITPADAPNNPSVAVVSRAVARVAWEGTNPVGRTFRIRFSTDRSRPGFGPFTVVGVVEDTLESLVDPTPPQIYTAFNQQPLATNAFLHIKAAGSPLNVVAAVARVVRETDPEVPLSDPASLESVVDREGVRPRFLARVLAGFATLALSISVIGLYAVSAWMAQQRQREAALRVALGATRQHVTLLLVGRGLTALVGGLAAGWLAAGPITLRLASELHGVPPSDLATRVGVAVLLTTISASALWQPAWRASGRNLSALLRAD